MPNGNVITSQTQEELKKERERLRQELGIPDPEFTNLSRLLDRQENVVGTERLATTIATADPEFIDLSLFLETQVSEAEPALVPLFPQRETVIGALGAGFKTGLLTPFQILREPEISEEGIDSDHPIARMFGEFGGIGVSFIPFLGLGKITLMGVGLTVPKLATFLSSRPTVARLLGNSIGFAEFEAGAGPQEKIATRAIRGLALGLATEVLFVGKALRNRGAHPPDVAALVAVGDREKISSFALGLERAADPEGFARDPEVMIQALMEIGSPRQQVESTVAKISTLTRGTTFFEGVQNQELQSVKDAFRKALPEGKVQVFFHETSATTKSVLVNVIEPVPRPLSSAFRNFGEEAFGLPKKIGRTGEIIGAERPPVILDDKAAEMILSANTSEVTGFVIEAGVTIRDLEIMSAVEKAIGKNVGSREAPVVVRKIFDQTKIPKVVQRGITWTDKVEYDEFLRKLIAKSAVLTPDDLPTISRISGLIHEAGHSLLFRKFWDRLAQDLAAERAAFGAVGTELEGTIIRNNKVVDLARMTFEDIFLLTEEASTRRISGTVVQRTPAPGAILLQDIRMSNLKAEFRAMTLAEEALRLNISVKEVTEAIAASGPKARQYFNQPDEQFVRGLSLLFRNPTAAFEIAPIASRMILRIVRNESPQLRALLTRGPGVNAIEWIQANLKNVPDLIQEVRIMSSEVPFRISEAMGAEFSSTGFFRGLEVVDATGKPFIFKSLRGGQVTLTEFTTARTVVRAASEVRPKTFADVIEANARVTSKLQTLLNTPPKWIGVTLRDAGVGGVRRAVIDLENYAVVRGGREGLRGFVTENALTGQVEEILANTERVAELVVRGGKKGLIIEDEGLYQVIIADRSSLRMDEAVISGLFGPVDGNIEALVINPTFDSVALSLLREAGAAENHLPYWLARMQEMKGRDLLQLVDAEIREGVNNSLKESDGFFARLFNDLDLDIEAQSHNLRVNELADGTFQIVNPETNVELARFQSRAVVKQYVQAAGYPQFEGITGDIVGGQLNTNMWQVGISSFGKASPAQSSRLSADLAETTVKSSWLQNVLDISAIMAPWTTPVENFAKLLERRGFGPAFTKIFEPAQRAVLRVAREIDFVQREWLDGLTAGQQLRVIQGLAAKVGKKRYPFVRGLLENMSREEIEAGGFAGRAMTDSERGLAILLKNFGLEKEIPRLTATFQMASNAAKNKGDFLATLPALRRRSNDPIWQETLARIEKEATDLPGDLEGILERIGMSSEERAAVQEIQVALSKPKEEFNLFTVSRWGDSRPVAEGFASGRAQYIAENGLTEAEVGLADQLERLMGGAAQNWADISGRRLFGGFWPHMRRWTDHGFTPDMPLMTKIIPDEFVKYSGLRMRSGEIDIYEVDPVLMAYKHVRSLLMGRHFDPLRPDLELALKQLRDGGFKRGHQVMSDYVDELIGRPITSFETLNQAIKTIARIFGQKEPDRIAEKLINNTVALGYGATIPFRASLLLRNYFQMFQMVPARIGWKHFWKGLSRALDDDGFRLAVEADAVPVGVTPVFASTEVLGPETLRFANIRVRRVFERGFEWYRKADDVGRSAAFHGFRSRAKEFQTAVNNGKITWEQFRARAKVNTFDSVDIGEFERIWATGNQEGAIDYLGTILARETHFRYGHANHPAGWGGIFGRLFGQFGTWPVQYKDYLFQGMARGSTKDKAEFLLTHLSVNGGMMAAGAGVGLNLTNWSSLPSLNYTGGPIADLAIDAFRAVNGSPAERALALRSMVMQIPTFDDPRSIFIPGSYFVGDVWSVFKEGDVDLQSLVEAGGFRFFEPNQKSGFEWLWGY